MAQALGPDERAALPVALAAIQQELMPIVDEDPDADAKDTRLTHEVTRASVLLSPHLDKNQRADWVGTVVEELQSEPFQLVMEGITLARRSCKHPADFVPAVIAVVLSRKGRLEAQRDRYEAMMAAAG